MLQKISVWQVTFMLVLKANAQWGINLSCLFHSKGFSRDHQVLVQTPQLGGSLGVSCSKCSERTLETQKR